MSDAGDVWVVCRCGEAVHTAFIDDHACLPRGERPKGLYTRWFDKKTKREILAFIAEHGKDPAFDRPAQGELGALMVHEH